jgi:hypothetical protein
VSVVGAQRRGFARGEKLEISTGQRDDIQETHRVQTPEFLIHDRKHRH